MIEDGVVCAHMCMYARVFLCMFCVHVHARGVCVYCVCHECDCVSHMSSVSIVGDAACVCAVCMLGLDGVVYVTCVWSRSVLVWVWVWV